MPILRVELTDKQEEQLRVAKTPLAFWRRHRGFTQDDLAMSVGIAQSFISALESGAKTGDLQTLTALANVLSLSIEDLAGSRSFPVVNRKIGNSYTVQAKARKQRDETYIRRRSDRFA